MARISSQKFIARNRAPRVQIEYDLETGGSQKKVQLPFVVGVFADLAGTPLKPPPSIAERQLREINIDNFDARMHDLQPRVAFSVADTLRGEGEMTLDLTFEQLDDFDPASIARRIPDLGPLLQARTQLANLATYMDGKGGAEELVTRLLSDRDLRCEVAALAPSPELEAPAREGSPESFQLALLREFRPKTEEAARQLARATRTLVEQAESVGISAGNDPVRTIMGIVANIDHRLEAQVNLILHHPDFQRLEGAWRGLYYLVSNVQTSELLKIRFMSLSKDELRKVLTRYRGTSWNQSPLFKKIYEEEYGSPGGEPYGCLIGDYEFSQDPQDVEILQDIARIASAAHVPFLSAAAPSLMKIDTWQDISVPRDISRVYSTADYASWRALRESEESRYLTLTMPRFLARLPYGEQTRPVEGFAFEEALQGSETRSFVWANSAYALGANIARAFAAYRWCALFQGPESGGVVEGLATHEFPSEDGGIYTSPTEIRISDRWEAELARNGLTPLVASKNAGSAVFFSAQSIQKPPEYDDPDITAAAVLAARLPYVLTCCRFVQYLKCIARSSVGSFRSREDMERSLNDWIAQYIDHDPASSSEEAKARRPLADAQIVVESIEGNPASHRGKIYLRPQYQLKSLPGSLRFATMLP